jgi:hypothetical protein
MSDRRRDDQEELGRRGRLGDRVHDVSDLPKSRDLARELHAPPFPDGRELGRKEAEERDLESHSPEVACESESAVPGAKNGDADLACPSTFLRFALHNRAILPHSLAARKPQGLSSSASAKSSELKIAVVTSSWSA